jgi:hypothetical protein
MKIKKLSILIFTLFSCLRLEASSNHIEARIKDAFSKYLGEQGELPKKCFDEMIVPERKELAKDIAKSVDTDSPDAWVYQGSNVSEQLSWSKDPVDGWLALRPGDVIYYEGAMGIKEAKHFGIYIGLGCTVEMWKTSKSDEGVIVLNIIEHFRTGSYKMGSICKPWTFMSAYKKPNELKRINVLPQDEIVDLFGIESVSRREILEKASNSIGKEGYDIFARNCQSFCTDIMTSSSTKTFQIEQLRHYVGTGYLPCEQSKFVFLVPVVSVLIGCFI